MSPRVANKDRAELPKPQVKVGVLGFSPLNGLTLSYRYEGLNGPILEIPEKQIPENITQKSVITVLPSSESPSKKSQKTEIPLAGSVFKSMSDALYRGKLPQVVIVSPAVTQLSGWLDEMMDYVEKTLQFGFFLQADPVDRLFPNFVFVSDGVYFTRLVRLLNSCLKRFPNLTAEWRQQILAKCHRAVLDTNPPTGTCETVTTQSLPVHLSAEPVALIKAPIFLKLAASHELLNGKASPYLDTIQSVLSLNGFYVQVEKSVSNAAERLELQYALQRSSQVIVPVLELTGTINAGKSKKNDNSITPQQVINGILQIGERLLAFTRQEKSFSSLPTVEPKAAAKSKTASQKAEKTNKSGAEKADFSQLPEITDHDLMILNSLCHYAAQLDLPEERELFHTLDEQLKQHYQPQNIF